jgi:hypothetical protein
MTRYVRRLSELMPPPEAGGSVIDWERAEKSYGYSFPDDYREFMAIYGEGRIDDFLSIYTPISEVYVNGSGTVAAITGDARLTGESEDYDSPRLLVAWGITVGSDLVCWRAEGADPNTWPIVLWGRHSLPPECWMTFDGNMVEFVERFARRDIPYFDFSEMSEIAPRFVHARD